MKPRLLLTALCLSLSLSAMPAVAGDGHDHGDAPPAASGSGPKRQPDGSVFLPKPAQRQIGVRTLLVEPGELPRTHELAGKVVMDPMLAAKCKPSSPAVSRRGHAVCRCPASRSRKERCWLT